MAGTILVSVFVLVVLAVVVFYGLELIAKRASIPDDLKQFVHIVLFLVFLILLINALGGGWFWRGGVIVV